MIKIDETLLDKATENDNRTLLSSAVRSSFKSDEWYTYLYDYDDSYVYFEAYKDAMSGYFRASYSIADNVVSFGEDITKVVPTTQWEVVGSDSDEIVTKSWLEGFLNKHFGGSSKEQMILKQFDDEQMVAIEPLYVPAGVVDAHGDMVASDDVTRGMVDSLNKAIKEDRLQSGLFHKHLTEGYKIEKAWITETDCTIGETLVKEGTPLVKVQFTSETLWEKRKTGELTGLSIGAKGSVEVVEE